MAKFEIDTSIIEQDKAAIKQTRIRKKRESEWYDIKSLLGYQNWAIFYIIIGAREAGKSYSIMNFCLSQWKKHQTPFYWIRLTDISVKKMLVGKNCDKFVDADLVRKYNLELTKKGDTIMDHGKRMATVLALSEMAKQKGVAYFDNEYDGYYNIVIDEFQREPSERNTFDIPYNMVGTLENIVRSRKHKVRIFLIANMLEECSDIMSTAFNFLPEKFGRYKLKSKRAVVDYIEPGEKYLERRKGTVADILAPTASNFTNVINVDKALIYKGALKAPQFVIKFTKDQSDWFTVWDDDIVKEYNGEKKQVLPMRPYLDEVFSPDYPLTIIGMYDARRLRFANLITQKKFQKNLESIKSRR